jgi:hypothetical protein
MGAMRKNAKKKAKQRAHAEKRRAQEQAIVAASPSPSPTPTVVPVRALPGRGFVPPGRYVTTMPEALVDAEFTLGSTWDSGGWWIGAASSRNGLTRIVAPFLP